MPRRLSDSVMRFGRDNLDAKTVALVLQLGAIIWGAAKIVSKVDALAVTVSQEQMMEKEMDVAIDQMKLDIQQLKDHNRIHDR